MCCLVGSVSNGKKLQNTTHRGDRGLEGVAEGKKFRDAVESLTFRVVLYLSLRQSSAAHLRENTKTP